MVSRKELNHDGPIFDAQILCVNSQCVDDVSSSRTERDGRDRIHDVITLPAKGLHCVLIYPVKFTVMVSCNPDRVLAELRVLEVIREWAGEDYIRGLRLVCHRVCNSLVDDFEDPAASDVQPSGFSVSTIPFS